MAQAEHNFQIDYIEFPATDIEASKRFYNSVFGWNFQDYGPDYTSFHDGRIAGGFNKDAIYLKFNLAADETLPRVVRDALNGPVEVT